MNQNLNTWVLLVILWFQVGEVFDLNNRLSAVMQTATATPTAIEAAMPAVPTTTPEAAMPTATAAVEYAQCTWTNFNNDAYVSPDCQYSLYWQEAQKREEEWAQKVHNVGDSYYHQHCNGEECVIFMWIDTGTAPQVVSYNGTKLDWQSPYPTILNVGIDGEITVSCGVEYKIQVKPIDKDRVQVIQANCFQYSVKNTGSPYDMWDYFK